MRAGRGVDELEGRRAAAMKPGDYAVQVNVIKCRDLKAEDLNGLSDPYARVRVHGRQRKTRVVKKVTSCVFDDVLHFSLPNLTTAAAEAAAVDIAILDHDAIGRHATIGSASFDLRKVHALADHELRCSCGTTRGGGRRTRSSARAGSTWRTGGSTGSGRRSTSGPRRTRGTRSSRSRSGA